MTAGGCALGAMSTEGPIASDSTGESIAPSPTAATRVVPEGSQDGISNASAAWLIAVASALGGAVATALVERIRDDRRERNVFKTLMSVVASEIASNLQVCNDTQTAGSGSKAVEFDAPLPCQAWDDLQSSGLAWRLAQDAKNFGALSSFYALVSQANHCTKLAFDFFSLSQQPGLPAEVARKYYEKAYDLATHPRRAVLADAPAALTIARALSR